MTKILDSALGNMIIQHIVEKEMVRVEVEDGVEEGEEGLTHFGMVWKDNSPDQLGAYVLEAIRSMMPEMMNWPDIPTQQKLLQHGAKVARTLRMFNTNRNNEVTFKALVTGVSNLLESLPLLVAGCRNMSLSAIALGAKKDTQ